MRTYIFNKSDFHVPNIILELSKNILHKNAIHYKVDLIAIIYINDNLQYNVYRRYNSDYNIIIHDIFDNITCQINDTIRNSLRDIGTESDTTRVYYAVSLSHGMNICSDKDILDMTWIDIQSNFDIVKIHIAIESDSTLYNVRQSITGKKRKLTNCYCCYDDISEEDTDTPPF